MTHKFRKRIPVSEPALVGNEKAYVTDCLESTWVSSTGAYIARFEQEFAQQYGIDHALSCNNGTAALHLAMLALGIGPGDEVIVPTLTFVATANCVSYCGATPIFIDSEPESWNLDPQLLRDKITSRTKAIIPVHLYGHPADLDPILDVARAYEISIVEDAAEAHGARYKGRPVGTFGDIGTFSFFGNKVITTGEGGMLVTGNAAFAKHVTLVRGQGQDPNHRYWFLTMGYNYRMTNVQAAIGLAQLERSEWHVHRRREVAAWYREDMGTCRHLTFQSELPWVESAHWMTSVTLSEEVRISRDDVMTLMSEQGIETRPVFYPVHTMPPYRGEIEESFPVAERLGAQGLTLPSSALLSRDEVRYVSESLLTIISRNV